MSVELGSFWSIKGSGCIAAVKSIIGKSDGGLTVVYVIVNSNGVSSHQMSCEYELFTNIAEKFVLDSEIKDALNKEYVKGKTYGYDEGYQHGFKLAKEKIADLDEGTLRRQYNKGFEKGSEYVDEYIKQNKVQQNSREEEIQKLSFNDGYQAGKKESLQVLQAHHNDLRESYSQSQNKENSYKKGYEQGYKEGEADMLEAVNELSAQQAQDWNESSSKSKEGFITESVCHEHHNPSKETQEAMQEVLDKELELVRKYPHYYKDIRHLNIIDIYRFFDLFEVTDPCIQHSVKKLSVGGKRGSKDYKKDIKEAMDTLNRWEYMQEENERVDE